MQPDKQRDNDRQPHRKINRQPESQTKRQTDKEVGRQVKENILKVWEALKKKETKYYENRNKWKRKTRMIKGE